jgi:hypothetical protein
MLAHFLPGLVRLVRTPVFTGEQGNLFSVTTPSVSAKPEEILENDCGIAIAFMPPARLLVQ